MQKVAVRTGGGVTWTRGPLGQGRGVPCPSLGEFAYAEQQRVRVLSKAGQEDTLDGRHEARVRVEAERAQGRARPLLEGLVLLVGDAGAL